MKNIDDFVKKIKILRKSVYIFGAGRIANIMYNLMNDNGVVIKGFLVSDISQNKSQINQLPVFQVGDTRIEKTMPVLVAVLEHGESKIIPYLKEQGFEDIVETPEGIFELDPWEHKRIRSPIIEVTAKIGCAVNCKYCPQQLLINRYFQHNEKRKSVMTFDDYKSYLDKCPENTIVDFSGFVETFLVKESIDMMEYTYKTGHEMSLFTTLRGLSLEEAKRVVLMPFKFVCLHTPDADGYANIPMTGEYFEVLDLFLKSKKENGEPFIDSANCQSDAHPEIVKRTTGQLKIYCEMSDRAGNLVGNDKSLVHIQRPSREISCSRSLALNHNVLLPDGSLALCCNDFGLEYIIGNLNRQSYEEIMRSEVIRSVKCAMHRDNLNDIICRKCIYAKEIQKNIDR